MPQFCGNCGTPSEAGASFCGNCGAPAPAPVTTTETAPATAIEVLEVAKHEHPVHAPDAVRWEEFLASDHGTPGHHDDLPGGMRAF
mmetsp:Transcript_53504/g.148016  ORF Transcript_53504/g.148016 Transcript_53504/m.148016 type:complete len:86 (-) Transcript_53504:401-658(-)